MRSRWLITGAAALLAGVTVAGCGSDKKTAASTAQQTQAQSTVRVTVPQALISERAAKALTESLAVAPGEKPDPEKIPRFFHVTVLTGRAPDRPTGFEDTFDVATGQATLKVGTGRASRDRDLWRVTFKGTRDHLSAVLPAFWSNPVTTPVAITSKSTLWAEVAADMAESYPRLVPNADVWALLCTAEFDPGPYHGRQWTKRRTQLLGWLVSAMKRFAFERPPAQTRVYAPLVALSITPLPGDEQGRIAGDAVVAYHRAVMTAAQRAVQPAGQGKSQIRAEEVVAPLATLNTAPGDAAAYAANLEALDRLEQQISPWPFDEEPAAHDAGGLAFSEGVAPVRHPEAQPPRLPNQRPTPVPRQPVRTPTPPPRP